MTHVEGLDDLGAVHVGAGQVEDTLILARAVLFEARDELEESERAVARAPSGAPGDRNGGRTEGAHAFDAVVQVEGTGFGERREELERPVGAALVRRRERVGVGRVVSRRGWVCGYHGVGGQRWG